MNVGQIARQQQMMYRFINRGTNNSNSSYQTQLKSQLSSMGGFSLTQDSGDSLSDMLRSMGISGTQGRTVREMAKYQMRTQNASGTAAAQKTATTQQIGKSDTADKISSLQKGFSVREQYTPISDKATVAMQKLALEDAQNSVKSKNNLNSANSSIHSKDNAAKNADKKARTDLINQHLKDVDPSKRTAAFNTMNKVWEKETERIGNYIKEKDPNWNDWGDEFDTSILDDYKPGVNVWV